MTRIGRTIRTLLADQRGAAFVLMAISLLAVVSAAAIAVDIGMLVTARTAAQRAADWAALAGASAFIDDPESAATLAPARAQEYAELHKVAGQTVDLRPAEDVEVLLDEMKVRVTVRQLKTRDNAVGTFFARVFGVRRVDIQAMAAAEAAPADAVGCLTPWAVADMWEDLPGGEDGKFDYDDADRSDTPTTGDSFDDYCPCTRSATTGDIIVEPSYQHIGLVCQDTTRCTGFGSDYRDGVGGPYYNDIGRLLTLKPGNPAQSWSPGWFMAWRPPENMGGADYKANILNCIDETMFDNQTIVPIDTEQGNMIGPTVQGVEERIGSDPHYWEENCTTGTSCIRSHVSSCGVDGTECTGYDERLVTVPLMDPSEVMRNGMTEIQFRGFMRLFLDDPSGNDITGHIMGLGGVPGGGGLTVDSGALPLYLRLVE